MSGPDPHEGKPHRDTKRLGITVTAIVLAVVIAMIAVAVARLT